MRELGTRAAPELPRASSDVRARSATNIGHKLGAASGFLTAYEPETAAQLLGSRDWTWVQTWDDSEAERLIWDATRKDLERLESGADHARSLLTHPLWLAPPPQNVSDDWIELCARPLERSNEQWSVWIRWYEARLAGHSPFSEIDEVAMVALPNSTWEGGPELANSAIAKQVA